VTARFLVGDVFERLAELPDASVDFVMTSPPFLALRSYLPEGHPNKRHEIGSERTPAAFLDVLLAVTAELRRVVAPHGSICVELGDTYAGSGGAGGDYRPGKMRDGTPRFQGSAERNRLEGCNSFAGSNRDGAPGGPSWPLAKSLTGIPTLYAWSLAYGYNLLTGEASPAGQWRIRNLVHWVRPNPPVGALGDKFRPATSYLVCATVAKDRWFDLDAVRTSTDHFKPGGLRKGTPRGTDERRTLAGESSNMTGSNPAGAPPLDWWKLSTRGYKGAHYAVYPPELCERPIKAMCPERVCTECGAPSRRIVDRQRTFSHVTPSAGRSEARTPKAGPMGSNYEVTRETLGWTDCGHEAWRPGIVLDPFAGTGTTLLVATQLGRDALGIDLDERNATLALERIGHLDVVDMGTAVYRNVRRRKDKPA
jgi:site-specific DNA-methyltransferase (adenine-specific)